MFKRSITHAPNSALLFLTFLHLILILFIFCYFLLEIPSASNTEEQGIPGKILYPVVVVGSIVVIALIVVVVFCLRKFYL